MAETTALREGGQTLLYVAATAPTDADDPTDAAYKVLGLQIGHDLSQTSPQVEGRNKRAASVRFGNRNTSTLNVTCHLSRTADDGQGIVAAGFAASPKTELYWLEIPEEAGAIGRRFRGQVGSVNETSQNEAIETLSFTIGVTTAFTAVTAE
jgi:hypothetical protein